MESDRLQPTIVHDSVGAGAVSRQDSVDASKAKVGFVAGGRPKFADETAKLLRSRLAAFTIVLVAVLSAAFIGNVVAGISTLWWLRAFILVALFGCFFALRSRRRLSLPQLRLLEFVVFGSVVIQVSLMQATRVAEFAGQDDAASVPAIQYLFFGAWCVLIFTYGIFVPNSWKRGAAVMVPAAIVPYLVLWTQRWAMPDVAALLDANNASSPIPLPLVAALVGTFGTHIINTTRREAFKARQFGQYRLLEKLGSGGMGEVYKAEHVLLKRPCAIKLIKPESEADATAIAHFEKEVKTTAKLTHWNTVEVYDYGHTEDGTFYYVMELLPGMSLEELVEEHGPLPAERVVHLLRQVCLALQEAHSVGLTHRDIKPANIFAAQRGGVFDVAKLLDFGLVKEKSSGTSQVSNSGLFSGTPLYMSPEQASAYENVDGRSDIYSLGAVAYYLLTGRPPFTGQNVIQLLAAHAQSEVVPPSNIQPGVPSDLEQIVLKCLEKEPIDRYGQAVSLEKVLAECACADEWRSERAVEWWSTRKKQASGSKSPDTIDRDVTMDHVPSGD